MPRILVADDEPCQLALRKQILEAAGHEVTTAATAEEVLRQVDLSPPDALLMDLRLPDDDGVPRARVGLELIREMDRRKTVRKIVVLSGWPDELLDSPEEKLVSHVLIKPVPTDVLLKALRTVACVAILLLVFVGLSRATTFPFRVTRAAEVIAELDMSSPGSNWSREGGEAALAAVTLDGRAVQHVMLYLGERRHTYQAFFGTLEPGDHRIDVERHAQYSAPHSGFEIYAARFREVPKGDPYWTALAHAPILYARADSIGGFTDIPLIAYCERLTDEGRPLLQYTMIFSNEDGGTSTRALMARWGHTTDVEYIYRAWLGAGGDVQRATIQAKDHKEIDFDGVREGTHPVLIPSTRNNMVSAQSTSPVRYQIPPLEIDLSNHAREEVMDRFPWSYRVTAEELEREQKLRPFGKVEGEKISDPRNYIWLEFRATNQSSTVGVLARLRGEKTWRTSYLGRADYTIPRDGWLRTTVELPPGTRPEQIEEIGFECQVPAVKPEPLAGVCRIEAVSKVFFLQRDYTPGASFWSLAKPVDIPSGQIAAFALR